MCEHHPLLCKEFVFACVWIMGIKYDIFIADIIKICISYTKDAPMKNVKILIVEDELIIAEGLKIMLQKLNYEVVAIFTSGAETIKNFGPGFADLIFMDIYLADEINGIDTAIQIGKNYNIPIIYLTENKDEHLRKKAIYEINTANYITKPFNKEDVVNAIDFALKLLANNKDQRLKNIDNGNLMNDSIFLKNGLGYKKVPISDIAFLKADGSYCVFTFNNLKTYVFSENLSYYGEKLSFAKELVRIHRSYIVNINFIERIHENRVWVAGNEMPIGPTYKTHLLEKFRFVY
jgi:DNA-binding LytR/AlgR family response regulator